MKIYCQSELLAPSWKANLTCSLAMVEIQSHENVLVTFLLVVKKIWHVIVWWVGWSVCISRVWFIHLVFSVQQLVLWEGGAVIYYTRSPRSTFMLKKYRAFCNSWCVRTGAQDMMKSTSFQLHFSSDYNCFTVFFNHFACFWMDPLFVLSTLCWVLSFPLKSFYSFLNWVLNKLLCLPL